MSINCTTGKWCQETLNIKNDLIKFIFDEHPNIIQQQASLPIDRNKIKNHPRLWEYAHVIYNSLPINNLKILDIGGLNNIVGFYLAKKFNCDITQVGLNNDDFSNLNKNCVNTKIKIKGIRQDIRNLNLHEFDIVHCINVIEHVLEYARPSVDKGFLIGKTHFWPRELTDYEIEKEKKFVEVMANAVKPGGKLIITYAYKKHGEWKCQPKCAYIRDEQDLYNRIILPSEMKLIDSTFDWVEYKAELFPKASTGIVILQKKDK